MLITKPGDTEYSPYYAPYIQLIPDIDLISALKEAERKIMEVTHGISEQQANHRYEAGKWSIKEVISHLNDAERVFTYRALRFSRNDKTELSGFDENNWVPESNAQFRKLQDILKEHHIVRQSSLSFFENITEEMSHRKGMANGKEISVRALGFIICGHALHHANILSERYLNSLAG
jgi:hypothetical protein